MKKNATLAIQTQDYAFRELLQEIWRLSGRRRPFHRRRRHLLLPPDSGQSPLRRRRTHGQMRRPGVRRIHAADRPPQLVERIDVQRHAQLPDRRRAIQIRQASRPPQERAPARPLAHGLDLHHLFLLFLHPAARVRHRQVARHRRVLRHRAVLLLHRHHRGRAQFQDFHHRADERGAGRILPHLPEEIRPGRNPGHGFHRLRIQRPSPDGLLHLHADRGAVARRALAPHQREADARLPHRQPPLLRRRRHRHRHQLLECLR